LLQGEHVLIEKSVQFFIRVVDAQLLEGIYDEILESENVQYSEKYRTVASRVGAFVNVIHQPGECSRVKSF
jgi:hypothetical protein